jgi:hypothetical protein
MTRATSTPAEIDWRLAEQHFHGTPAQVSADLEDLILILVACRQSLELTRARQAPAAPPALWRRLFAVLGLAVAITVAAPAAARAQAEQRDPDPAPPAWRDIVFGVTFEGYYAWNANDPRDRVNALRAYDTRANTFSLQQLASVVELPVAPDRGRRWGLRLDLQAGQATETVQGSPLNEPRPDVYRNIWQAFGSYVAPVGRGLQLDFGKFASNLGYETNYAKDNQAFTRAYLFNFLPFYHMGLRATLPVHDRVTLMGTLTNGIQQTEEFNGFKSFQASATVKPVDRLSWTINYYTGREQPDGEQPDGPDGVFRVFDTYATFTPTPKVALGLDVNHTSNELNASDPALSLSGIGAYARVQVAPRTALGLRYERLDDEGLFGGADQVLQEITLTAEQQLASGLLLRVEYRHDWSSRRYFPSDDGTSERQPTLLVGAIWWFGSKSDAW